MWANKSDIYVNKFICQYAIIDQIGLVVVLSPWYEKNNKQL